MEIQPVEKAYLPLERRRASRTVAPTQKQVFPELKPVMNPLEFREAVVRRHRANSKGDPSRAPYIYSIAVVKPGEFSLPPQKFEERIATSSVPNGFLYATLLYQLDQESVERILVAYAGAHELEVKFTDQPGGAFQTTRVRLVY